MPHVIEYAEGTARLEVGLDDETIVIWAAPLPYSKPAKLYFRLTTDEAAQLAATLDELIEAAD